MLAASSENLRAQPGVAVPRRGSRRFRVQQRAKFLIGMRSGGQRLVGEIRVQRVQWELYDEGGAAFGAIEAFDAAAVLLHDAVADAEAQASAFADGLGGEERIEHMLRRLDARPTV